MLTDLPRFVQGALVGLCIAVLAIAAQECLKALRTYLNGRPEDRK